MLANGVLHHIDDDEARGSLNLPTKSSIPMGALFFHEPCYLLWQSRLSAFMMSKDRGQNIRTDGSVFPSFFTNILTGVNRCGYVCIIDQCRKTIAGNDEGKKTAWRNGYEAANFAVRIASEAWIANDQGRGVRLRLLGAEVG